jgi:hypothetical protein
MQFAVEFDSARETYDFKAIIDNYSTGHVTSQMPHFNETQRSTDDTQEVLQEISVAACTNTLPFIRPKIQQWHVIPRCIRRVQ